MEAEEEDRIINSRPAELLVSRTEEPTLASEPDQVTDSLKTVAAGSDTPLTRDPGDIIEAKDENINNRQVEKGDVFSDSMLTREMIKKDIVEKNEVISSDTFMNPLATEPGTKMTNGSSGSSVSDNKNVEATNSSDSPVTASNHSNTVQAINRSSSPVTVSDYSNTVEATNSSSNPVTTSNHRSNVEAANSSSSPVTASNHSNTVQSANSSSSPVTTSNHSNTVGDTNSSSNPVTTSNHRNNVEAANSSSSPVTTNNHSNTVQAANSSSSPVTTSNHSNTVEDTNSSSNPVTRSNHSYNVEATNSSSSSVTTSNHSNTVEATNTNSSPVTTSNKSYHVKQERSSIDAASSTLHRVITQRLRNNKIGIAINDESDKSKFDTTNSNLKRTVNFQVDLNKISDSNPSNPTLLKDAVKSVLRQSSGHNFFAAWTQTNYHRGSISNLSVPSTTSISALDPSQLDRPSSTIWKEGNPQLRKGALKSAPPYRHSDSHVSFESDEVKSVKFQSSTEVNNPNGFHSFIKPRKLSSPRLRSNLKGTGHSPDITVISLPVRDTSVNQADAENLMTNGAISFIAHPGAVDRDGGHSPTAVRTGLCGCANLSTERGRRNHALMIMFVSVIPVVALLIQNSIAVYDNESDVELHTSIREQIMFSIETGNVVHRTQIERGATSLFVGSKGDDLIKDTLLAAYNETDKAIEALDRWIVEPGISYFKSVSTYHKHIQDFRMKVLSINITNLTSKEVINFYSNDNAIIVRWVGTTIQHSKSGHLWRTLLGYYMLILSKEQAGVERAAGSAFYTQGGFDQAEMLNYLQRKILGGMYLNRASTYSTEIRSYLMEKFTGGHIEKDLERMRLAILDNNLPVANVTLGAWWFTNMTTYINILKELIQIFLHLLSEL